MSPNAPTSSPRSKHKALLDTEMERTLVRLIRCIIAVMHSKRSSPQMLHRAGELRQQLSPAEKRLWTALRNHQLGRTSFRRSDAIGPYVADFCAPRLKLVIELDGEPHRTQQEADAERTQYLASLGYRVIRFWNTQVLDDLSGVLREIERAMCANH